MVRMQPYLMKWNWWSSGLAPSPGATYPSRPRKSNQEGRRVGLHVAAVRLIHIMESNDALLSDMHVANAYNCGGIYIYSRVAFIFRTFRFHMKADI
jgi:hypothetical protein